jgi:enamine deaminase RidA (YjgF/YER057c/UK114 family)
MDERKLISSGSPYEKSIGFSRAVRIGNTIAVSGTAPIGPDGKTVGEGDAYVQARRCLQIIKEAIEEAGGRLEDVVRTRIYITDLDVWEQVGKAHGEFFADIRPAATMIVVKSLVDPDWLVEIEAECII